MKIHEYNEMMAYLTRPARVGFAQGGVIGKGGMFQGQDMGHRTGYATLLPKVIEHGPKVPGYIQKAKTFVPLIKKGATDILNRLKNLPEFPFDKTNRSFNDLFMVPGKGFRKKEWGPLPDMSKAVSKEPIEDWQSIPVETFAEVLKNKRGNLSNPDFWNAVKQYQLKTNKTWPQVYDELDLGPPGKAFQFANNYAKKLKVPLNFDAYTGIPDVPYGNLGLQDITAKAEGMNNVRARIKKYNIDPQNYYTPADMMKILGLAKKNRGLEDYFIKLTPETSKRRQAVSVKFRGIRKEGETFRSPTNLKYKLEDVLNVIGARHNQLMGATPGKVWNNLRKDIEKDIMNKVPGLEEIYKSFQTLRRPDPKSLAQKIRGGHLPSKMMEMYQKYNIGDIELGHKFPLFFSGFKSKRVGDKVVSTNEPRIKWINENIEKLIKPDSYAWQSKNLNFEILQKNQRQVLEGPYKKLQQYFDKYQGNPDKISSADREAITKINNEIIEGKNYLENLAVKYFNSPAGANDPSKKAALTQGVIDVGIFDLKTAQPKLYGAKEGDVFYKNIVDMNKDEIMYYKNTIINDWLNVTRNKITDPNDLAIFDRAFKADIYRPTVVPSGKEWETGVSIGTSPRQLGGMTRAFNEGGRVGLAEGTSLWDKTKSVGGTTWRGLERAAGPLGIELFYALTGTKPDITSPVELSIPAFWNQISKRYGWDTPDFWEKNPQGVKLKKRLINLIKRGGIPRAALPMVSRLSGIGAGVMAANYVLEESQPNILQGKFDLEKADQVLPALIEGYEKKWMGKDESPYINYSDAMLKMKDPDDLKATYIRNQMRENQNQGGRVGFGGGGVIKLVKGAAWVIKNLKKQLLQFEKEDFMGKLANISSAEKNAFKNEITTLIKQLEGGGAIPHQMLETMRKDKRFKDVIKTEKIKEQITDSELKELEEVLLDYGKNVEQKETLKQFDVTGLKKHASGGRVGFDEGSKPKSPGRRAFLKGITALAALPIVGKYFKLGKVLERASTYTGPAIQKIKGMPEWFPGLVKKLWNEGEDVTKQVAYKDRQVVKRGTLEGGDDVDMIYDIDTGDVSINVTPKQGKYETTSGAYNKEYSLDFKKGDLIEEGQYAGKTAPDEFAVGEVKPSKVDPDGNVDWDADYVDIDEAMTDLSELENFVKKK